MVLRLYNTLTRRKEEFQPLDASRVRMYVCGPTVYQRIHLGNARAFVVFDVLYRLLRHLYGEEHVVYVRNITDIDDKIMDAVARSGESIDDLTKRTTGQFQDDLKALGCLEPNHEPRATKYVEDMKRLINDLITRGHAYEAEGHVLFNVPSYPDYGRLSGRNRDEQIAGARVDVAPYKRDPADFVLWKPSAEGQPGWDSPWGRGRPGWHIECSAMSERLLGVPFDIHAGGLDLIFPHHENEIAQTCCAHGIDSMAQVWMHNGFLDMRGEKMSKSVGNVVRVDEALKHAPGEVLRLMLLTSHYRQPADYTEFRLQRAEEDIRRFYRVLAAANVRVEDEAMPSKAVLEFLGDDLNTPRVLSMVHAAATRSNTAETDADKRKWALALKGDAQVLGLLGSDPETWLKSAGTSELSDELVETRLRERAAARRSKDFALSDSIRNWLQSEGIVLKDRPDGTTAWERAG